MAKKSKQDLEWEADSDAHMLVELEKMKSDKPRHKRALARVEEIRKNAEKTVKAARGVMGK